MKWPTVLLLLFLMATQAFSKWVLLLEFRWNQDYIAKTLCINKTKPKLKCGGRCQLMKRLTEEEKENAPSQSPSGKSNFQEVLFTTVSGPLFIPSFDGNVSSPTDHQKHWKPFTPPCAVFHPPLV